MIAVVAFFIAIAILIALIFSYATLETAWYERRRARARRAAARQGHHALVLGRERGRP